MRKDEKGFGVIEILILVVVIGLVAALVWNFFNKQNKSDVETTNSKTSIVQDPSTAKESLKLEATSVELLSGIKSEAPLSYSSASTQSTISNLVGFITPDDWRPDAELTSEGCGKADCMGQSVIVLADEDNSAVVYPDYFAVTISAFQTNQDAKTVFATYWQDAGEAAEQAYSSFMTNDGEQGFKYDFAFNGNDAQGKYTEHVAYGISHEGTVVILDVTYFNGSNKSFANTNQTDYGQYASQVEQIAKSLRIVQ